MNMQNVHPVAGVRGCIVVVPATACADSPSVTHACSLRREIGCRTVFPFLHIHIHAVSDRKLVVVIDVAHRCRIDSRICKFEPQFTRSNPPTRGTGIENGFLRPVIVVYMDIIIRVNRVSFHSIGGRFQAAPKFVVAFSGRTPVAIIEIVVLCLYVSFILFDCVRSADKNGGIGGWRV